MKLLATALAATTILTACAETGGIASSLDVEAGVLPGSASFGSAVEQNAALNRGVEAYRISLTRRFEAEVQSMVTFPFNSYALDDQARAILRQQAGFILQFPEVRFKVYGHTDLVGSRAYNRQLGLARAQAVVLYLTSIGVPRNRLEAVVSFGETQPLIVTEGRERANRRTVTEVSGFVGLDGRASQLDGQYAAIVFREYVDSAVPVSALVDGEPSFTVSE